ncbi:winged helix-turn-helix domain-containing tetratricopeptide repeat protein [Roseisalinus antarcticus]|uniref:winged helix-turn-helix domain-containing tetratricopeptide repeat protein n=1 Tax=Roseisalinus antarcticus TaxID=254357 RepID=UPI001356525C|nr:winged helix-turn-helix domain-containing protein [Roseisalinus antarcticus]
MSFGPLTLDLRAGHLTRDGQAVSLRSKAFAVLDQLARRPGEVVSKDALMAAVWPDVTVTEDSLTQAIRDIRRVLGPEARDRLRTVARRGYALHPDAAAPAPPKRPRIALLPLQRRSGGTEASDLIDGLIEEITIGLSRFRSLAVIARHSAFAAADEPGLDLPGIGARLGADYVMDGTAHLAGDQLRLSISLNDVATGEVIWAESLTCVGHRLLTLQDLVPRRIVQSLALSAAEGARRQQTSNPTAFAHYARAVSLQRQLTTEQERRAHDYLLAALRLDPDFALAHCLLARAEIALEGFGLSSRAARLRAREHAARAVELAPDEAQCLSMLGFVHCYLEDWQAAETLIRRAIAANPCLSDCLADMAFVCLCRGRPAESLTWLDRAEEINPLKPPAHDVLRSEALFAQGHFDAAARALASLPQLGIRQLVRLAAIHACAGDSEGVRRHLDRAFALDPAWDCVAAAERSYLFEHDRDRQHLLGAIRAALRLYAGDAV